ncbi:hypothetical protein PanWU01x14_069640 [Parasponia andersonii]|uniref:Uncharacterized protein n=1 Tax=Parasponia andersonii TaxID=3476 RepID=A0A2P5DFQ3_PARAD|nr:hypothetical protein PanWU01x14_069640 [Parasponia andersonii]
MRFLNLLVLFQYVPRILPIYQSSMELRRSYDSITGRVWVKGAFNLFLYITASHDKIKHAFRGHKGYSPNAFSCHGSTSRNLTSLKKFSPVNPPNATIFDFGIFIDPVESGMVGTTDFPKQYLHCFWWGLQNLMLELSLAQNLKTSSDVWETCFEALISVMGLLLFPYLIGNLQTYMQVSTTRAHERRKKI